MQSSLVSRNQALPHSHAARKVVWFSMAAVSDSINSQTMLRIFRESKMTHPDEKIDNSKLMSDKSKILWLPV